LAISVKRLLEDYFYAEDLQDALGDIGEPISGTKSELIKRLLGSWFEKNRTLRDLLDFLPDVALADLCQDFNIDPNGERATLIRRIMKNSVIQSPGRIGLPSSNVSDRIDIASSSTDTSRTTSRPPYHPHHYGIEIQNVTKRRSFRVLIISIAGVLIALGGVLAFINGSFEFARNVTPTPQAQAELTLNVISPNADLLIDTQPHMIRFAPEITPEPINGEVTLVIDNIGNAPARNVYIEYLHEPQVNNWYDHRTTVVEEGAVQDRGSNQGYQGTLKAGDTIRIKYLFTINPNLYPEANLSSPTLTFHVMYDENKEVLKQYLVCFDDCIQKAANYQD